ncbi:hypothetical protein R1flu_007789 [Riccia fluitans]|uniref:Uncharacterized protein n=1 Tax=Riccia fluitans TaxID=41844 RepID=A0ABD1Z0Q7_9MARC
MTPILHILEESRTMMEEEAGQTLTLPDIALHLNLENKIEEMQRLREEAERAKEEKTRAEEEAKHYKLQIVVHRSEMRTKKETMRIAGKAFKKQIAEIMAKIDELTKQNEHLQQTCADLTREKNEVEDQLKVGEELCQRIVPALSSFVTVEIDQDELALLRSLCAEVEHVESDESEVRSRLVCLHQKVHRELRETRMNAELQISELRNQLGLV